MRTEHYRAGRMGGTKILWVIRRAASYRQGHLFLRFELGGVNRFGIQIKRRHLRVAEKFLNRLYVLAPADQKRREAVTEIVEAEPLPKLQPDSSFNGSGAELTS